MSNHQVTPITGLPQVDGWAQVITHPSRLLTCVLSVSGKNANSVGKTLAEHVAHFQATNSAELHNALLDLLQSARQEDCQLQLACALVTEDRNILATHSGSVFLRRGNKVGIIVSSQEELKIIEGSKVADDLFVLATEQAVTSFPDLKENLLSSSEDIVPSLVADLQTLENSSLSALAWLESGPVEPIKVVDQPADDKPVNKVFNAMGLGKAAGMVKRFPLQRLRKNPLLLLRKVAGKTRSVVRSFKKPAINIMGEKANGNNRRLLLLAAAVIVLLGSLIAWKQYQINQELETLQPRLGELQQQLTEAKNKADQDPLVARTEAKAVLRGLEDLIAANQDKEQAVKKLKDEYQLVQAFVDSISGSEKQGAIDPFFDLRLAEAGFIAKDAATNEDSLLALDAGGEKAVALDLTSKQASPIPFDGIGNAKALTAEGDKLYVLAEGLHQYDLNNDQHDQLKEQGDSDRDGTFLASFGDYLYVLNPTARNVYRYLQGDDGLSDPIGWLVDKQNLEFDNINSMAIDGDIWLTTKDGQILKYTQGAPQAFNITDLEQAFDSPIKIATQPDSDYLYILENSRQRLVVLKKDGLFFKEVISESLSAADTIAVSSTEDAVFVISGSLVYKISL